MAQRVRLRILGSSQAPQQNKLQALQGGHPPVQRGYSKRELLEGYVNPSASPMLIVEALRRGEMSVEGYPFALALPAWDSSLELPVVLQEVEVFVREEGARGVKRTRSSEHQTSPSKPAAAPSPLCPQQQQVQEEHAQGEVQASVPEGCLGADTKRRKGGVMSLVDEGESEEGLPHIPPKAEPLFLPEAFDPSTQHNHSGGNSDQTTQLAFHSLGGDNPSPPEVSVKHEREPGSMPQPEEVVKEEGHQQTGHTSEPPAPVHHQVLHPPPEHQRGCSIGTQAGDGSLLPPSLLQLQGANESMSATFNSVSPHDFILRDTSSLSSMSHYPQGHPIPSEAMHQNLISAAQAHKRMIDKLRGGDPWTPRTISGYVEACLMFIDACELKMRIPARTADAIAQRTAQLVTLYGQIARMLMHTARDTETLRGTDLVRELLRILCERLAAVCLMRVTHINQHRMREYAARMEAVLERSRQGLLSGEVHGSAQAGVGKGSAVYESGDGSRGGEADASHRKGPQLQPSPMGSTTSSQDQVAAVQSSLAVPKGDALPQMNIATELGPYHASLLASAKSATQYADLIRKSTLSFQALLERQDVRESQPAKVACMHIAALCMDMGIGAGAQVTMHGRALMGCTQQMVQ